LQLGCISTIVKALRNKGSLLGGGISVDVHSGGGSIVEYLPLLYLVVDRPGYRRVGVTVATVVVVVVATVVVVALAALRGGIGLGVVGRARVLGG